MAQIVLQNPVNFSTDVIRNIFIEVQFDTALLRSSVTTDTVILVDNATQLPVEGVADYITGTKKITFQLFDFLKENSSYTVIIVGGATGVLDYLSVPFTSGNYVFTFTTGTTIDWDIPLAPRGTFKDGEPFTGNDGIYRQIYARTGDLVSHIVTTAAQVNPSGVIAPAPFGAEHYLQAEDAIEYDPLVLVSTSPVAATTEVPITTARLAFTFNNYLDSIGTTEISVQDILGRDLTVPSNIDNYSITISDDNIYITPSGDLTELPYSAVYNVIVNNVEDVYDQTLSSVSLTFTTKIYPLYTTVRIIRLKLGALITGISDDSIIMIIYENSIWAYENATTAFPIGTPTTAAINYVTCKTQLDLIERMYINSGGLKNKGLGDFIVGYNKAPQEVIERKINALEQCVETAEALITGSDSNRPVSAVKSYFDPRSPSWKRLNKADFT